MICLCSQMPHAKLLLLVEEHKYKISPREEVDSLTGKNGAALEHSWPRTHLPWKSLGQELFPTRLQGTITQQPHNSDPVPATL